MFIIIDQRIVKEASHTLSLQEAIYIMWGKILGMKFQNVFLIPLASVDTNMTRIELLSPYQAFDTPHICRDAPP